VTILFFIFMVLWSSGGVEVLWWYEGCDDFVGESR
jgi:hypothetical protein